ncbi:hypothetical protein RI054_20g88610 [Pseudoscourfieldia marina]
MPSTRRDRALAQSQMWALLPSEKPTAAPEELAWPTAANKITTTFAQQAREFIDPAAQAQWDTLAEFIEDTDPIPMSTPQVPPSDKGTAALHTEGVEEPTTQPVDARAKGKAAVSPDPNLAACWGMI